MFLIIPKKVRIETTLTPAQCRNKINRETVEYNRRPSLIAVSGFIKKHRFEACYYGSTDKNGRFELFYHKYKKHDGSSAGFFGHIEKHGKGSLIVGKIRRTAAVTVTAIVWTVVLILLMLSLAALKEYEGAGAAAAVFLIGLGLITYDGSESFIKAYLDSFPKNEE